MSSLVTTTQIDILRHGECEGGHIFRGHSNMKLASKGMENMQQRIKALENHWDVVISSPLIRCQAFAQWFCETHKTPLVLDSRIQEMSFGEWEGVEIVSLIENADPVFSAWRDNPEQTTPPGGESLTAVKSRVTDFLQSIKTEHAGKKVLLVTHGGLIRILLGHVLHMPLRYAHSLAVPYACLSRIAFFESDGNTTLQLLSHNMQAQ